MTRALEGKKFLVTGGAGGIGMATAKRLVADGGEVAITDLDEDRVVGAVQMAGATIGVRADIASEKDVSVLFDRVFERFGGLDGIVSNAGIMEPISGTRHQQLDTWRRVIDVNLQGSFLVAREGARRLSAGSAIVNISSVSGLGAFPGSNAYGVSKAALVMLTQTLACELARFGIRVNAVAPGVIEAAMGLKLIEAGVDGGGPIERRIPLGRLGRPGEVARAIAFLLSDAASYITGITLPVDGGWSAFGGVGDASPAKSSFIAGSFEKEEER